MHPYFGSLPAYQLSWLAGIVFGALAIAWLLRRAGCSGDQAWLTILLALGAGLIGAKGLYLLEVAFADAALRPAPFTALFSAQMRLPGGILAIALAGPWIAHTAGLSFLAWADLFAPGLGFAVFWLRIGCFLQGCCFGMPSDVPWAVRFPRGAEVFAWQHQQNLIPPQATHTLPVHPLQLYFGLAGLMTFVGLAWYERRKRYDGEVVLFFGLAYLWSTSLLELFRALPHALTFAVALAASVAVTILAVTVERRWRHALV